MCYAWQISTEPQITDSTRNSLGRALPKNTPASAHKWTRSSTTQTQRSQLCIAKSQVCCIDHLGSGDLLLRAPVADMQAAQEELQKKNQELVDLYREKSKKLSQMTNLYNLLKARAMKSRMETAPSENVSQTLNSLASRTGPTSALAHAPAQPATSMPKIQKARTPKTPSFAFSPEGVEQLHRYQRSGTGSSKMSRPQRGGKSAMPPPAGHAVFNIRTGKRPLYGPVCSSLTQSD